LMISSAFSWERTVAVTAYPRYLLISHPKTRKTEK
jgi:hypothetical protein